MNPADICEGDVIRLTPGGPPYRVYRDYNRGRDAADRLVVNGTRVVSLPAAQPVELIARHGNRRAVSLVKAWYSGPVCVGSVVTYRHAIPGAVFRVVDIEHGPTNRYRLAPYSGGDVAFADARVGDLRLVRSHAAEAVRRVDRRGASEGQGALFGAGDAA